MKVVSAIIEHDIHSSQQVPSDLGHLMNRLKLYSNDLSPWARQHASHFEEDEKSALFFRMHSKLKNLEQMDPPLYKAILKIIETIPDSKDWLGKALLNTHLHVLLRYRKWDSKQARTLSNVVARFLNSTVPYVQDGDGLLTCRHHGHAHMEADASVDTIGHMEAALYGAVEGLKAYHQMQYEADKAAFKQHQIASVDSLETCLLKPMPIVTATAVGQALEQFLSGAKFSLDEAKPGAAAAAIHVAKRATKSNRVIHLSMVQAAVNLANLTAQAKGGSSQPSQAPGKVAVKTSQGVQGGAPQANLAAVKVAGTSAQGVHGGAPQANQAAVKVAGTSSQGVQGGAPKAVQPIDMFNANDVDHMYNLIAPNLLVVFQRIMFDRKQCYRLTEDTKVPRLID